MADGDNWARKLANRSAKKEKSSPPYRGAAAGGKAARRGGLAAFVARGRAQARKKNAEPDKEKRWKAESKAGVELDGRDYKFKRGNDEEFLKDKKVETTVEAVVEKTWAKGETRALYYGDEHRNLTIGKASGSVASGGKFDFKKGEGSVTALKLEGSAALLEAKGERSFGYGVAKVEGKLEVLSLAGKAELGTLTRGKDGKLAVTLAELGAEANLVKGEIGGELSITPRTVYDNLIGPVVGLFTGKSEKLSKDSKWADHGLVIGGKAEAGIGAAAKASAKYEDGKLQIGAKAGAGPMAGFSLVIGLK